MSYQKVQSSELQLELHKLLLKDTDGGKLYKYRSFDKDGYSLKNLQEGTLHCSKADTFNDPFECKIGVTFQSLYDAMYKPQFDVVGGMIEKYIKVFHGEIGIDECSIDEQRIMEKLLANKNLKEFIVNNDEKDETQEDVEIFYQNNIAVIVELMQIIFSDEMFMESLGSCVDMLPRMMENISTEGRKLLINNSVSLQDHARANGIIEDQDEIGLAMLLGQKRYPDLKEATEEFRKRLISGYPLKLSGTHLLGFRYANILLLFIATFFPDALAPGSQLG